MSYLKNYSLNANIYEAKVELVTILLTYKVTVKNNQVDRDIKLNWTVNGNCTGTTYTIKKSIDNITFTTLSTTTGLTYTDSVTLGECKNCTHFYYYVTVHCNSQVYSNTIDVFIEPVKTRWNLGGLKRLWIASRPSNMSYFVVDATYKTLEFYGNDIQTINYLTQIINWYELPVYPDCKYDQKMVVDANGYTFAETLAVVVPKLNPDKWQEIQNVLGQDYIAVFQTNNDDYCIMGYDSPARIEIFEATTEESKYNFTIQVNGNYNLMKFINENYVKNNILI